MCALCMFCFLPVFLCLCACSVKISGGLITVIQSKVGWGGLIVETRDQTKPNSYRFTSWPLCVCTEIPFHISRSNQSNSFDIDNSLSEKEKHVYVLFVRVKMSSEDFTEEGNQL